MTTQRPRGRRRLITLSTLVLLLQLFTGFPPVFGTSTAFAQTQPPTHLPAQPNPLFLLGLTTETVTDTDVLISWHPADAAVHYKVFLDGTEVAQVTATSYAFRNLTPHTRYRISVAAVDAVGTQGAPAMLPLTTLFAPPPGLAMAGYTSTTANLTWQPADGATRYVVRIDGAVVAESTTPATTVTGLEPATTYTASVAAMDGGAEGLSAELTFTTRVGPPTGFTVSSVTGNSAMLSWDAAGGMVTYKVRVNDTVVAQTNMTNHLLQYLSTGITHSVSVTAVGPTGIESDAAVATFTTLTAQPGNLSANVGQDRALLWWTPVTGAVQYAVRVPALGSAADVVQADTDLMLYELPPGTAYTFEVTGIGTDGRQGLTAKGKFTTMLAAPTALTATHITQHSATLGWSAVTGATKYVVKIGEVVIGETTETTYSLTGLAANSTYPVTISAVDSGGRHGAQGDNMFKTLLPPPSALGVSGVTETGATVSWAYISGVAKFQVRLNGAPVAVTTGTSYTLSGLADQTDYTVSISGVTYGGQEGEPITQTFTTSSLHSPGLTLQSLNDISASLQISRNGDSGIYRVWVNDILRPDTTATNLSLTGLTPGANYRVLVASVGSSGAVEGMSSITFTTMFSVPASVTVTDIKVDSARITWPAVSGATGYSVSVNGAMYATTATQFTTNILGYHGWGAPHDIAVAALNANGQVGVPVSKSIQSAALPAPVGGVTGVTTHTATLSWQPIPGAVSYKLRANGTPLTSTSSTRTISNMSPETDYVIEVAGVNGTGLTGEWARFMTRTLPLQSPSGLTGTFDGTSAFVNWRPVERATAYAVYLNGTLKTNTSSTSHTITGLLPNTRYSVAVAALTPWGTGPRAEVPIVTDQYAAGPPAPANLKATSAWYTGFTTIWDAVDGAMVYDIWINGRGTDLTTALSYNRTGYIGTKVQFTVRSLGPNYAPGGSSSIYIKASTADPCDPMAQLCTVSYPGSYLIGAESQQAVSEILTEHGKKIGKLRHQYRNVPAFAAEMTEDEANALRLDPRVKYVEPDSLAKASEVNPSWSIGAIRADLVQAGGVTGEGVKVAVIDTGVAAHDGLPPIHHLAFGNLTAGGDETGHGTHVAGTVTAVAPGVELYALKAFDASGNGRISDILAALDWAVENKIQVVNMSFASSTYSKAFARAVAEAARKGVLMVAAAGNAGQTGTNTVQYPARFPDVVAVGATDENQQLAPFSSVGPALELVAPGVAILSTLRDGTYGIKSGTSMAAPHVAGAAALVWSQGDKLRSTDIRAILNRTAQNLGSRSHFGYGLVDAQAAVAMVEANRGEWKSQQGEERLPKPERFAPGRKPEKVHPSGPVDESNGAELGAPSHQETISIWVTQDSTTSANLKWSTLPGASRYRLARYYPESDTWTTIYEGTATTYNLTGLTTDVPYYVGVSVRKQDGTWSPWSHNVGYAQIYPDTYDTAPQFAFKAAATSTSVKMRVETCDPTNYNYLWVRGDASGNWTELGYTSSCEFTAYSPSNTWYGYSAYVYDKNHLFYAGTMGGSGSTIVMTPPPAPVVSSSATATANSITVSWSAVPGPSMAPQIEYVLLVNGIERATTTATTYTLANLNPDTAYEFKVYAKNKWNGRSDMSTARTIRTTPPAGTCKPMTASAWINGTQTTTTNSVQKCWDGNGVGTLFVHTPGVELPGHWVENRDYRMLTQNPWVNVKLLEPEIIVLEGGSNQVTVNFSTFIAGALTPTSTVAAASGTATYTIVISAGINSELDHFDAFLARMQSRYPTDAEFLVVFPYGYVDASWANDSVKRTIFAAAQAVAVEHDTESYMFNIGGKVVRDAVGTSFNNPDGHLWFIGHSGGGVASIRGYQMLVDEADFDEDSARVITVGSPRTKFNKATASHVYYIYDMGDPVHHIGLWWAYPQSQIQVDLEAADWLPVHGAYFNGSDKDIDTTTEEIHQILIDAES